MPSKRDRKIAAKMLRLSQMRESNVTSGETTPTGAMTPSTTDTNFSECESFSIRNDRDVRTKEDEKDDGKFENYIMNRIEELLRTLSQSSRRQVLSGILRNEGVRGRPCIGTVGFCKFIATCLNTEIPYVSPHISIEKPTIVAALSGFTLPPYEDQGAFIFPTNQNGSKFDLLLDGWMSTSKKPVLNVHVNWLELQSGHTRSGQWQNGEWLATDRFDVEEQLYSVNSEIKFSEPFRETPKVVVFLSGIRAGYRHNLRFRIAVESITTTGFRLKGGSWDASTICNLKISWVAYRSSLKGVYSGSVSTESFRKSENPQHHNMGYVAFPTGMFTKPPKVMVGLSHLDLAYRKEQNIKAYASNVSAVGMCWNTDSWGETVNYGAGISYLAIEESE